jgi:hypothetical protein
MRLPKPDTPCTKDGDTDWIVVDAAGSLGGAQCKVVLAQQCLNFLPDPHGHGSLRPIFGAMRREVVAALCSPAPNDLCASKYL